MKSHPIQIKRNKLTIAVAPWPGGRAPIVETRRKIGNVVRIFVVKHTYKVLRKQL